jgi:hypothetical protein
MASRRVTPLQLESSEGPTELVRLYVQFNGLEGKQRKGKVVAWEGPGCGYTVRILGRAETVTGVDAGDMQFLENQEEVDIRTVPEAGTGRVEVAAASSKRGRCMAHDDDGRVRKRERLASIFIGVMPIWN